MPRQYTLKISQYLKRYIFNFLTKYIAYFFHASIRKYAPSRKVVKQLYSASTLTQVLADKKQEVLLVLSLTSTTNQLASFPRRRPYSTRHFLECQEYAPSHNF